MLSLENNCIPSIEMLSFFYLSIILLLLTFKSICPYLETPIFPHKGGPSMAIISLFFGLLKAFQASYQVAN